MARLIKQLSALDVTRQKEPGLHPDGGGLYLRVAGSGNKTWVFRYMLHGKAREMGLGSLNTFSLADARRKAEETRKMLDKGEDPISARKAEKAESLTKQAKQKTFRECAEWYVEHNKAGWRNVKHADQWKTSLKTYVYPVIGDLPVQEIDVTLVLNVLEQKRPDFKDVKFWEARPVTANRVRNRIERVLDSARRFGRTGENPARWKGNLKDFLPDLLRNKSVRHHAALPYEQIGDFITQLKEQNGLGVNAFEFLILTASRTSEVTGATWGEFDLDKRIWAIPGPRYKTKQEHRVPLCGRAIEILKSLDRPEKKDALVFHGRSTAKPLSKMGLLSLLERMERTDITPHGFRTAFRVWCAEQTSFPREVSERALGHEIGNAVEAAYKRTDLLDKRRLLMEAWAVYCATPSASKGEVIVGDFRKKV